MRAVNHALTGALTGLLIDQPAAALPLAVASHYICDALPHYGGKVKGARLLQSDNFRDSLIYDALGCGLLVLLLAIIRPEHWLQAAICAFLATAPDLFWIPSYILARRRHQWHPGSYSRFAAAIQWFERPIGAVVEIAWLVAGITLLLPFLR